MNKKSGLADSPFFTSSPSSQPIEPGVNSSTTPATPITLMVSRHHDTVIPSNHDTVTPRHHDTSVDIFEVVRKAVREIGKEAATHRFTVGEKRAVAEVIYHCKQQGIKTTENEIARISVNYLLEDYRMNGDKSILSQVLRALNA